MKLSDPIKLPTGALNQLGFNQLNLHIAGVALLGILNIVLLVRLGFALRDLGSSRQDQLQQAQLQLAQLRVQSARLDGLPEKVGQSRKDADKFYGQRIPANYSSILAELGTLAQKNNIRLTRAGYTQTPALEGLAELRIDANLAGEYSGIMHFINGLERDKSFFVISAVTLTGQQGGLVNLRLRLNTYLHAADASKLPPSSEPAAEPNGDQPAPKAEGATDQSALRPVPIGPSRTFAEGR
jgi:type IV pilus assembly protein PilO